MWAVKTVTPPISSDSCGMLPVCASHIITRCSDHWNAMCAAAWSQDNEIDQYVSELDVFLSVTSHDLQSPSMHYNLLSTAVLMAHNLNWQQGSVLKEFWQETDLFYANLGWWYVSYTECPYIKTWIQLLFSLRGCVTLQIVLEQQLRLSRKPGFGWLSKTAGQTPKLILKSLSHC